MSSDEGSVNNDLENNDILVINEDQQDTEEQTEEVLRDETAEVEGGADNEDGERKTVKPKRTIRNPQPKLNAETLKGPRGIAALESYFDHVKFKGKGKEYQDLDVIMKTYEYWCHRLFPKFPFDTCIERLEKLGSKRAVQTQIKRIRFDLLIEDKPILSDSDEEPNVDGFVDIQNDEIYQQQNRQFDELLSSSAPAPVQTSVELTEEQLERIRLNKERAEKLKHEKLKKIRNKAEESLQVSSQLPGTSGLQNEIRKEQFDALESTQCDIFSQDDSSHLKQTNNIPEQLDDIDDSEALFDHESNVKGKTSVKGVKIKKKSNAFLDSDSEISDNEDKNKERNGRNVDLSLTNERISDDMKLLDMDQNSSDIDFTQKKGTKRNVIFGSYGDDDQSDDQHNNKNRVESRSISSTCSNNKLSDDSNSSIPKMSNPRAVLETDESDQELDNNKSNCTNYPQFNQHSDQTISGEKEYNMDINHIDQEMDTNQVNSRCDKNSANCASNDELNNMTEHLSEYLVSPQQKSKSFSSISSSANNIMEKYDSITTIPSKEVVAVDVGINEGEESMDIIEN